ncbi:hypothetical protein [Bacteroides sp. HPS0048]|uniref:hypothetical protein n=2 Tax=Bacteroides TaxID=816 RepID=UPI0035674B93
MIAINNHKELNSIYVEIKGLGFTFLLDKRMKHNLINPVFLNFFKEEYPVTEEEYQANQIAVEKLMKESKEVFPVLPEHLKAYYFRDVYKEVDYGVVRCSDNKLRRCKAIKFNFEHEGHPYSELFFIDKSVEEDYAILGSTFWSRLVCDSK